MNSSQLAAELHKWTTEFFQVSGKMVDIPPQFYSFLANRLTEIGVSEEDPDVLTINFGTGITKKVRIVGIRKCNPPMLVYEEVNEFKSSGLCHPGDVLRSDRSKLSSILTQFEREGKI